MEGIQPIDTQDIVPKAKKGVTELPKALDDDALNKMLDGVEEPK